MSRAYPYAPKARLTDIIVRRNQTLRQWMDENAIALRDSLMAYCRLHDVVPPTDEEFAAATCVEEKGEKPVTDADRLLAALPKPAPEVELAPEAIDAIFATSDASRPAKVTRPRRGKQPTKPETPEAPATVEKNDDGS